MEPINKEKKLPAKWYALLYLMSLKASGSMHPETSYGELDRKELEKIGRDNYGFSKGQTFYVAFKDVLTINNIEKVFKPNWKETLIKLSNGNKTIIDFLNSDKI